MPFSVPQRSSLPTTRHLTGYEYGVFKKNSSSKTVERVAEAIEREMRAHSPDDTKFHRMHA